MLPRLRTSGFIAGLAVMLAIPVSAVAKPTSSFVVSMSASPGTSQYSVEVDFDELGVSSFDLVHTEVAFIPCLEGSGIETTTRAAAGPVDVSSVSVSRNLASLSISGSTSVSTTVSTYCPETGLVEQTSIATGTFELDGVASERLRRGRLNGDRVLSSTLSPLRLAMPDLSVTGVGLLTETISK